MRTVADSESANVIPPQFRIDLTKCLPSRPSAEFLRRLKERVAYEMLEILMMTCEDGYTSDPKEIARHYLLCGATVMAAQTVEAMRELGHSIDHRFNTDGQTLRYLADLCDYYDTHTDRWADWTDFDGTPYADFCAIEGRKIPMPRMPRVQEKNGPRTRLKSVPM